MIVNKKQLNHLGENVISVFSDNIVFELRNEIPDWIDGKKDNEVREYVIKVINVGKQYKIYKQDSLKKFVCYHIKYQYSIPIIGYLENILLDNNSEEKRLENFYHSLISESYLLEKIYL